MVNIIAKYEIIYENGISQISNLIDHSFYLSTIVPLMYKIEDAKKHKKELLVKSYKKEIDAMVGKDYFTTGSPMFRAIKTGLLKFQNGNQGGPFKISINIIYSKI